MEGLVARPDCHLSSCLGGPRAVRSNIILTKPMQSRQHIDAALRRSGQRYTLGSCCSGWYGRVLHPWRKVIKRNAFLEARYEHPLHRECWACAIDSCVGVKALKPSRISKKSCKGRETTRGSTKLFMLGAMGEGRGIRQSMHPCTHAPMHHALVPSCPRALVPLYGKLNQGRVWHRPVRRVTGAYPAP